jgi:hypothetical protein
MGQSWSTPAKSPRVKDENEADIWSSVVHISDRDVLVQNIGRRKKQKVKLSNGQKSSKMENIHLADRKRLEGIPSFKRRNARWIKRCPVGIVNQGSSLMSMESMDEKSSQREPSAHPFLSDEVKEHLVNNN